MGEIEFDKVRIGTVTTEACCACDINNDGILDIVCGEYWFEGPEFTVAHKICDIMRVDDYYDDFSNFPMDVNGDGFVDIVSGGWWGESLVWRENPGRAGVPWKSHVIASVGNIERPCFHDIDGDGEFEIIPNTPNGPLRTFKLVRDRAGRGTGVFREHVLFEGPCGHGIGFGDIAGHGRCDIVLAHGWLECPRNVYAGKWRLHEEFHLGSASVPVIVHDVNRDGAADLIVGQAHDYGLAWWEQLRVDGRRTWRKHDIDTTRSQYHDLQLADIDADGELELVTGKRYRAHCGADPGAGDPLGLYYFKIAGGAFERKTIDYGPPGIASGAGIYFWMADLDNTGSLDLIAPGKDGLFVFRNRGRALS